MTEEVDHKLRRQQAIKSNMDPLGKMWGISLIEGTSLYVIGLAPEDGNGSVTVPKNYPFVGSNPSGMEGSWTKPELAQQAIERYLSAFWDYSEAHTKRNERKEHAAKVAAA